MTSNLSEKDFTTKIIAWLPLTSLLILTYGTVKILIYYSLFNVNIFDYIEISEILPLILKDFIYAFLGISIGLLLGYLNPNPFAQKQKNKNLTISETKKSFFIRIWYYFKSMPILFFFLLSFLSLIFIFLIVKKIDFVVFWNAVFVSIMPIIIYIVPLEIFYRLRNNRQVVLKMESVYFTYAFILLLSFSIHQAVTNYLLVRYRHTTLNSYITFNSNNIISNLDYYYIGRTKSSIFFYNQKIQKVDIYSSSNISKMFLTN